MPENQVKEQQQQSSTPPKVDPQQEDHLLQEQSQDQLQQQSNIMPPKVQAPKPPNKQGIQAPKTQAPKPPVNKLSGMTSRNDENTDWETWQKQGIVGGLAGTAGTGGLIGGTLSNNDNVDNLGTGQYSGMGVVNLALLAQSGMTIDGGMKKQKEGKLFNDKGLQKLGKEDVVDGGINLGKGVLSTTKGGLQLADKLGTAGVVGSATVLGIVGNAITLGLSGYALIQNTRKLWPNIKSKVLSARGDKWRKGIMSRQKCKAAVNALKVAAATAGIVGGALLLASNPVGWAVGLAAAITLGSVALVKGVKSIKDKRQVSNKIKEMKQEQISSQGPMGLSDMSQQIVESGDFKLTKQIDENKRKELKELSDSAKRELSSDARLAGELRGALNNNAKAYTAQMNSIHQALLKGKFKGEVGDGLGNLGKEYVDANLLVELVGVRPDEARSTSGQQLLEKKISAWEG